LPLAEGEEGEEHFGEGVEERFMEGAEEHTMEGVEEHCMEGEEERMERIRKPGEIWRAGKGRQAALSYHHYQ
jgi:hypothetical protein